MKNVFLFFFLSLSMVSKAQIVPSDTLRFMWEDGDRPEPNDKDALVTIRVLDYHEMPVRGIILWALQTDNQKVYESATGEDGKARFLLPKGKPFQINAEGAENLKTFRTIKEKLVRSVYVIHIPQQDFTEVASGDTIWQRVSPAQTPTFDRVKVLFTTVDLDKNPLEGELVLFTGKASGKIYAGRTNSLGRLHLMLPEGDTYCIGLTFEKKIECLELPASERAGTLRLTLTTIGTKAFLRRKAERERELFVRDSIFQAKRLQDSIANAELLAKLSSRDFLYQLELGKSLEEVQENIEKEAAAEKDSLAKDEHYFEKNGKEVEAVLYRMRKEWTNKVIVTDVTCSMDPYMDQILIWHALQLTQNEHNRYLFFNDGDGKPQEAKIAGQTGGIHLTDAKKMPELITSMADTKAFGCSGDGPENDLEALLEGVKQMKGLDELVLVADNYSDVRDIELLEQLNIPVRVILAGSRGGVNEQYLEIAFKTGGSVHTLERDIADLAKMADGETIEIGEYRYRVNRGKFIQIAKM